MLALRKEKKQGKSNVDWTVCLSGSKEVVLLWPSLEEREFDMTTDRGSGLSCRVQSIAVRDTKRLLLGVMVTVRDSVDDGCPSLFLTKVCGGADGGLVRKRSACFVLVDGKRGAVSLVSGDGRRRC